MKKKNIKTYTIDSKKWKLNVPYLKEVINSYKIKSNIRSNQKAQSNISNKLGIGDSTLRSWLSYNNSPNSIDDIKKLSSILEISNYKNLLIEANEEQKNKNKTEDKKMNTANERQKEALRRIYVAVINYLNEFEKSDGFNNYWFDFSKKYKNNIMIEDAIYEIAEKEANKVLVAIKSEYLDLYNLNNIYDDLISFAWNTLYKSFDGKVSYAYRFEAGVENMDGTRSTLTTDEDYEIVLDKINELLEPYF